MKNKITIFDTKSKQYISYSTTDKTPHSLYVCGITPYDFAHIGHGRCYVFYDTFVRLMRFFNKKITYCRNITNIDDKLITKARNEFNNGKKFHIIAEKYYESFIKDIDSLHCIRPDYEPKVTDYINEIISFIEDLLKKKYAYCIDGNIFFSIEQYKKYGTLSGKEMETLRSGARIEIDIEKKHPGDFVLWKKQKEEDEPFWHSPWGKGRPGWHIECSAMSKEVLGYPISFHGGGEDLIFPHHENEQAQSECHSENIFVSHWIHCAFIRIKKEKMSKSLGNSCTLKELFTKYHPAVIRFYFLNHHYRSPIDFSYEIIESFEKGYKNLISFFSDDDNSKEIISEDEIKIMKEDRAIDAVLTPLLEDLNTAQSIGAIFKHINEICSNKKTLSYCRKIITNLLGLPLEKIDQKNDQTLSNKEILQLIEERNRARSEKDFKKSDEIRDFLKKHGILIEDKKIF